MADAQVWISVGQMTYNPCEAFFQVVWIGFISQLHSAKVPGFTVL